MPRRTFSKIKKRIKKEKVILSIIDAIILTMVGIASYVFSLPDIIFWIAAAWLLVGLALIFGIGDGE